MRRDSDDGRHLKDIATWVRNLGSAQAQSNRAINLVPSENMLSPLARLPLQSDLYNRYFFNDRLADDFWEFRGGQEIGSSEVGFTAVALRELAGVQFVNIRPISGLSAMMMAISALGGPPCSPVICVSRSTGGHFATESLIRRLGYEPRPVDVVDRELDQDQLALALKDGRVELLYLDVQNTVRAIDIARVVEIVKERSPRTRIHVDSSHSLGLVLGGISLNPCMSGADSFGGSTHKTFPGPQKGVLFTDDRDIATAFELAQFDMVSSHHFAETLSLGLAAAEFRLFGRDYAQAVVKNTRLLAGALQQNGFEMAGGIDDPGELDSHQLWIRLDDDRTTDEFSNRLYKNGIRVNIQSDLPGTPGKCVRLGTNEVTFAGAGEDAMLTIAEALATARTGTGDSELSEVGAAVRTTFGPPFHLSEDAVRNMATQAGLL